MANASGININEESANALLDIISSVESSAITLMGNISKDMANMQRSYVFKVNKQRRLEAADPLAASISRRVMPPLTSDCANAIKAIELFHSKGVSASFLFALQTLTDLDLSCARAMFKSKGVSLVYTPSSVETEEISAVDSKTELELKPGWDSYDECVINPMGDGDGWYEYKSDYAKYRNNEESFVTFGRATESQECGFRIFDKSGKFRPGALFKRDVFISGSSVDFKGIDSDEVSNDRTYIDLIYGDGGFNVGVGLLGTDEDGSYEKGAQVKIGFEAALARIGRSGTVHLGPIDINLNASGFAGGGALTGEAKVTNKGINLHLGLGIGVGLNGSIEIDYSKVTKQLGETLESVGMEIGDFLFGWI